MLEVQSPLTFVLARGADTSEKLLPKDRGKPKLRLFAFEQQGSDAVRVGQGSMAGKLTLPRLALVTEPAAASTNRSARLVLAARDGNGKLKLLGWQMSD